MAIFRYIYPVDYAKLPRVVTLPPMFSGDINACRVGAKVTDNGATVALSGTCKGVVVLSNGAKVSITGTVSNDTCYITLTQAVFAVVGGFKAYVMIETTGETVTLLECTGQIRGVG